MSAASEHDDVRHALTEARRAYEAATEALHRAEEAAIAAGVDVDTRSDAITVQRINVVEPDGTLRLVITNAAQLPGLVLRGEEHAHPNREPASGLVFFNDEATETGGLLFGGRRSSGSHVSGVHLRYDNFEQDQVIVCHRATKLQLLGSRSWSSSTVLTGRWLTWCGLRRPLPPAKRIMVTMPRHTSRPGGCGWLGRRTALSAHAG